MQTDILIVGGGLSGLSLADQLAREGRDFLLYEAQDRLGGRIMTNEIAGRKFDLGPAWFWPGQPRMADLTRRFNIPVFEQFSTGDLMFQDQTGAVHRGRGYESMEGSDRLDGGMGALLDALQRHKLPGWAAEIGCENWAQVALKFVVSHPAVTCAIPATSQVAHVRENLGAARGPQPDAALRARMAAEVAAL